MENLTGGTPPVRYLLCVVPCKLHFIVVKNIYRTREYSDMSYNWLFFMLLAIVSIGVWYIIVRGLISTEGGMICVGASLLIMNMVSYKLYESVVDAYRRSE